MNPLIDLSTGSGRLVFMGLISDVSSSVAANDRAEFAHQLINLMNRWAEEDIIAYEHIEIAKTLIPQIIFGGY